jgi:hypothetical protein
MAVCCQYLTLGALSSRSARFLLLGALFKKFGLFLHTPRIPKGFIIIIIVIIVSIQPLGRFWQKPEPSQATGMALARCILGKFLGVVCHCFNLLLDVPILAARCLHVPNNASAPR